MRLLAIDPGAKGGLAYIDSDGIVQAEKMPEGMTSMYRRFQALRQDGITQAVRENVGKYMPGNSGPAAVTFSEHVGFIKMGLFAADIADLDPVTPQKWQKALGFGVAKHRPPNYAELKARLKEAEALHKKKLIGKTELAAAKKALAAADTKAKQEHKNEIKETMARRYPHLKVTLATADALGILTWAMGRPA